MVASLSYLRNTPTQVARSIMCAFFLWLWWNADAGAACRLHFRNGSSIEVGSYEDHGDSISYLRYGGVITVPKTALSTIENLTPVPPPSKPPATPPGSSSHPGTPPEVRADFSTVERKDLSDRRTARLQFRIQVDESATEPYLRSICEQIIAHETNARPLNAIEFLFYRPGTDVHGPYTAGRAYWAPNGNWADADSVQKGEYCTHALVVTYGSAAYEVPKPPPPVAAPAPQVSRPAEDRPAVMPRSLAEQVEAERRGADALAAMQSRFPGIRSVTATRAGVVVFIDPLVWRSLPPSEKQRIADEMMHTVLAGNGNIAVPMEVHDGRGRVALSMAKPMRMEILR